MNTECDSTIHLSINIIQAYTFDLINNLYILIDNYQAIYKPMQHRYLNKNKNNKFYLTIWYYRNVRFKCQNICHYRKKRMKKIEMDKTGDRKYIMISWGR